MVDPALFALPGVRRTLIWLGATNVAAGALVIGQALSLTAAITLLWTGAPVADALPAALAFLACFGARQLVRNAQDARMEREARETAGRIRHALLAAYYDEGPRLIQQLGSGSATTTALEGIDRIEAYLELMLPKLVAAAVIPAMVLICVSALDVISGIIALVALPTTILFMVLLGQTAQERAIRQHAEFQRLTNHFIDTLRGLETLRAFGRSRTFGTHVFSVSERFREATMRTLAVGTLSSAVLDLVATFGLAAIAIMLGFRLSDGTLAAFPALAVLILVPDYFAPLRAMAADFHATLDGKNALAQVTDVLAQAGRTLEEALEEDAAGQGRSADTANKAAGVETPIPAWSATSTLTLRGVGLVREDGTHSLDDVTHTFTGFERVGIVGLSGAGKTTLAQIVAGFLEPTEGAIELDGARVGSLHRSAWHRQVALIPQHPYIFSATLRENIAWYRPDASDDQIIDAMTAVGLANLASRLPQGLDTPLGEGGRALSGGEAHRVALARAVLDEARRIWILDEPTAHLDIETELELKEQLVPLFRDRLVIMATHRLHWADAMDTVLVLENGKLVEAGAPAQLAAAQGGYMRMARAINGRGGKGGADHE